MLHDWIDFSVKLSKEEGDFYSGARKIIRNRSVTFKRYHDVVLSDAGYTKSKLTMLKRLYYHEESVATAVQLWQRRVEQRKYGSVGFTTYNHLIKNDPTKRSKRASVMGPCIQAITLTYLDDRTCAVDAFYRTTEIYKKFPADLVFIQELMEKFDFSECPITSTTFHFANITVHPMYFVTIIPHLDNPIATLDMIKRRDPYFFDWVVKWSARYLVPRHHRGIAKFAQALRVQKDAQERIKNKKRLIRYLDDNHPGYRNRYSDKGKNDVED